MATRRMQANRVIGDANRKLLEETGRAREASEKAQALKEQVEENLGSVRRSMREVRQRAGRPGSRRTIHRRSLPLTDLRRTIERGETVTMRT